MVERRRLRRPHDHTLISLRRALDDPNLLGDTLVGDSWLPWRALLLASQGEQLTDAERAIFQQLTGREHEPDHRVEEFIAVIGRRGGKSRAIIGAGHLHRRTVPASIAGARRTRRSA